MRRTVPSLLLASAFLMAFQLSALAWWQFIARGPNDERQASARFETEKECNAALKTTEAELEKKYPDPSRFPLVGSCEEYH
jgi:hypothetical protein